MKRILVVDDHEVVRKGIRSLLERQDDLEVCGEAVDGQDAVEKARQLKPDVIVMDISMPKLNGLEATRSIRSEFPETKVLMLSQHESEQMVQQSLNAGACGYVVKSSAARDLLKTIEQAGKHDFFSPHLTNASTAAVDAQEIIQRSAALELALRDSEERFRLTFEQAAVGMAHVAEDGRWLRLNRKFCEIIGYTEQELLKLRFQDVTHPLDVAADVAQASSLGAGDIEHYSMEKRYIRKDGRVVWVNLTVGAVRDSRHRLKYFISVVENIDSRKNAEDRLREAEHEMRATAAHLELVTNRMAASVTRCNRNLHYVWANQQYADLLHRPLTEIAGRPILEVLGAQAFATLHPYFERVLAGETVTYDEEITFQGVGTRWVSGTYTPTFDAAGAPDGWVAVVLDFTDRRQAEQELRESKERSRTIIETTPECVKLVAPDGTLLQMNSAGLSMIGADCAEMVVGKNVYELVATEDRDKFRAFNERICRGEKGSLEFDIVGLQGVRRHMATQAAPLSNPDGSIVQLAVTRDITQRKRIERDLSDRLRQQEALFQLADQLHRSKSLDDLYRAALDAILKGGQCDRASILLFDDADIMRFVAWRGLSETYRKATEGHSPWKSVDKEPEPICINDVEVSDLSQELKTVVRNEGIGALAFIPLVSGGKLIGKFMAYFNAAHVFTHNELNLSVAIARQLGFGIDRGRADEALRESEERFRKLAEELDSEVQIRTIELEKRNSAVLTQSEQLQDLSQRLLRIQDDERRRIARDLHDSAGQTLAVLDMNLAQIVREAKRSAPQFAKTAEESEQLAQQLTREIRTTSYLLHPPLLDESGLSSALRWYVQGLVERSGLDIQLGIPEEFGRLPSDMELTIFRIVQECLTNIHRHSGSKSAVIQIARNLESVFLEVEDHGSGMSSEHLAEIQSHQSGVGIRGMRERVRQFCGEMKIESSTSGTKISVRLPAHNNAVEKEIPSAGVQAVE